MKLNLRCGATTMMAGALISFASSAAAEEPSTKPEVTEEIPTASKAPAPAASAPPFHPLTLALVYPLATNFGHPDVHTAIDISLLYGRVGSVDGLSLAGVMAHVDGDVHGFQPSGAGSLVGGNVHGMQVSGVVNIVGGDTKGLQAGGAMNYTGGNARGAQFAGVLSFINGDAEGFQAAGIVSRAGAMKGMQVAGMANVAGPLSGAQISGGFNYAREEAAGAQIGVTNVANDISGVQIGVVNVGRKVHGLQLGIVNIAKEMDGAAIGVANITPGGFHPIVLASNLEANVGMKFASKYFYSVTSFAVRPKNSVSFEKLDEIEPGFSLAFGGHVPIAGGAYTDIELGSSYFAPWDERRVVHYKGRAMIGYSFADHLSVFAGGGVVLRNHDENEYDFHPEGFAGVQF